MNRTIIIAILILCLINISCKQSLSDKELPSGVGEWVKIDSVPQPCGYYLINGKIYGFEIFVDDAVNISQFISEIVANYTPVSDSDPKSFKVCINDDNERYAKDDKSVYYPVYYEEFIEGEYFSITLLGSDLKIPGADPKTFRYIGKGYAVDKRNMYFSGEKIKWNDSIIDALQKNIYIRPAADDRL